MKGLDARIARLEKATGLRDNVLCVIVRSFAGGGLCGYRTASYGHESAETIRQPKESEDDLLERAKATASPRNGMIVLRELRGHAQDDETQE